MGLYCPNMGKLDILVCNLLIINSVQKCPVSDKNPVTGKNVRRRKIWLRYLAVPNKISKFALYIKLGCYALLILIYKV